MFNSQQLHLARAFLKIFLRDRQSIFFSLFFPIIFMTVFSFVNSSSPDPYGLGVANNAKNELSAAFIETLDANPLFDVTEGTEDVLKARLVEGESDIVLVIPNGFSNTENGTELKIYVDAAKARQLSVIVPILEKALLGIERGFRQTGAMFTLVIEDVQARTQRYLDFLLPGILAFTLMQISIAGSGFNIVEYRRKGILKRLFVTPIEPKDFIAAIVIARLVLCLTQLSALLLIAVFFMDAVVVGSIFALYTVILLGAVIFLCLGFSLGSIAKTQQSVQAIGNIFIFPQMFLSGIFYPIDRLPELVQPVASLLPLTYVANALREISVNGLALTEIMPDMLGIAVWMVLGFVLATRYFIWREVAA